MREILILLFLIFQTSLASAEWRVEDNQDEFDGRTVTAYTSLKSDSFLSANPMLVVRYRKTDKLNVILMNGDSFICGRVDYNSPSARQFVEVAWKFDDEPAQQAKWSISTSSNALFADNAQEFSRKLIDHNSLLIRTTDGCGAQKTLKFSLSGSTQAITTVLSARAHSY